MSTLSDRLRDATRDIVTGERLLPGLFGHSPIEDLEAAADELDRLTARVAELEALVWRNARESEECECQEVAKTLFDTGPLRAWSCKNAAELLRGGDKNGRCDKWCGDRENCPANDAMEVRWLDENY